MAGDQLRIDAAIPGDAVLAGSSVQVTAPVQGDGVIAGGELDLRAPFGADLYAAAGQLELDGSVAGSARLAGGEVTLGPGGEVSGGVSIAAGRAEVSGNIGEYLQVTAGRTLLNGHVEGDVHVSGGELDLGPSAVVEGTLTFRGPEPASIAPGALVRGGVRHIPSGDGWGSGWSLAGFAIVASVGLALVGGLAWALLPGFTRRATDVATSRSGWAFAAGLSVVVVSPILIALMFASLFGIPLALLATWLYVMLFPLGYLAAVVTLTQRLLARLWPRPMGAAVRVLALIGVLLLLSVLALVPVLGPLAIVALTLLGIGALALTAFELRRGRPVGAAAAPPPRSSRATPEEGAPASM